MRSGVIVAIIIPVILLSIFLIPLGPAPSEAYAVGTPAIGVSSDTFGHNLTSLTQLGTGTTFTVSVNVTNAGALGGFDITLNYGMGGLAFPTVPIVVDSATLAGGLFDPSQHFADPNCSILTARGDVIPVLNRIRYAVAVVGGCTVAGTGRLLTLTFTVINLGVTFIDIVLTDSSGHRVSTIVSGAPTIASIPFQPISARFQNVPGIPPVAQFSYSPTAPVKADNITLTGVESYDPDNSSTFGKGISKYLWIFSEGTVGSGMNQTHEFLYNRLFPIAGNFSVTLVVWDVDNLLPDRMTKVISVTPGIGQSSSFNWSGYAISSVPGGITDVKGSWIVPGIEGSCGSSEEHSSFWVGIDGLRSPTVEQTGTDSACINGNATYFAWYEFFPRNSHVIHAMNVKPGDVIFAEVSLSQGRFNATLADITTGASFTKLLKQKSEQASSAEWIAEAPSSSNGILPLANFGSVTFGQYYTGMSSTCYATVDGAAGPIGSFGSKAQQITMIARDFTVKAQPSKLSADESSFSVQWLYGGP